MNLSNKKLFRSLSALMTGSLISIVFLAIQHILLPIIFTPEELGIKSVILAIPTACIGIVCGRYDLPIVYEEDENLIPPLLKLNFIINFCFSVLITGGCSIYLFFIKDGYSAYWYTLPAVLFYLVAYGATLTLNSYNNRYRDYQTISKMYVLRSGAQSLVPVILGFILITYLKLSSLSVAVLVIPYCVGAACGLFSQGRVLTTRLQAIKNSPKQDVFQVARKHIKQLTMSTPAILANGFSYSLITIIVDSLFGETATGYYSLSVTLLGLPITLISSNLSKIYMRDAANEYENTGGFRGTFKKHFLVLFSVAIPMFFCVYYLVPSIFTLIFGEKWAAAVDYIKVLSLMFSLRLVFTALSPGLYIVRKQSIDLVMQVALLIATLIPGILCWRFDFDILTFLRLIAAFRSMVMLVYIIIVYRCSKNASANGRDVQ